MSETLIDPAPFRRVLEARKAKGLAEKAHERAERELADAELAVYELLVDSPVRGELKVDVGEPYGVQGFQADQTIFGRVLDKDAAIASLEQSGHGDVLVRQRSIAKARLNEHVRDLVENNQPLPEGVDWYENKRVKVSAKKKKPSEPSTDLT